MIIVDAANGSWELQSLIAKQGIACDKSHLAYADACFEGHGPDGLVTIGVERKRLSDVLDCINNGRLTGHQLVGMKKMYRFQFVIIEGYWRPDTRNGLLLVGHPKPDGTVFWSSQQHGGRVMYAKLRRYLFSVNLGGAIVLYTRDIAHTAFDITELYHYFQKKWRDHKTLLEMHVGAFWQYDAATRDLMALPSLAGKPSLTRRWAKELGGIGVKLSEDAERVFKTPRQLANADESEWLNVPGVGVATAQKIVREVGGYK